MTREQVDQMLSSYKGCLGRAGHLELELPIIKARIERDISRLCADAALETPAREEGMPFGGGVGNPVERIVLKYADGFIPEDLQAEMAEMKKMEEELREKQWIINHVDIWLKGLDAKERWIVENKMIDTAFSWYEIGIMYKKEWGEDRSKNAIKRLRDAAMEKIYAYAT